MSARPGSDGPEDVDAAFAEIVAELERDGVGRDTEQAADGTESQAGSTGTAADDPRPPETGSAGREPADTNVADSDRNTDGDTAPPASTWRTADHEWDPDFGSDEHYEPPEPPPLPRLRASTILALVLVVIALVLFFAPGLLGIASATALPIAVIATVGAAVLLLLRLRTGTPPGAPGSDDDGAQV